MLVNALRKPPTNQTKKSLKTYLKGRSKGDKQERNFHYN